MSQLLKKGDKVVMHACGEATFPKNHGVIWTCKTDEFTTGEEIYRQDLVFLEGFSGSFLTKYLQFVSLDREEQLIAENERLNREIASHGPEGRNYTNQQYVTLLLEHETAKAKVAEQDKEIQKLNQTIHNLRMAIGNK